MKVGKLNKTQNTVVTTSVTSEKGFDASNVTNEDTLKKWKVTQGTATLTLDFDAVSVQAVCVFNANIEADMTIKTFNSLAVETNSITINYTELKGIDSLNGYLELTDPSDVVKVQVIMNGPTATFETSIGYVWIGDLFDFKNLEALAATDNAADDGTITRANTVSKQQKYNYQSYKVTTNKSNLFLDLQNNIREMLRNGGYLQKRPFLVYDCECKGGNMFLGTFDTGVFQYDVIDPSNSFAQTTKGVIEVF